MIKKYRNFVVQKYNNMERPTIISDYNTFLKEQVSQDVENDGKNIKIFYTVETKRIEVPIGSDTGSSIDNKKAKFEKIFRRIKKVSKFIKVPEPTLTLIAKKKYFACAYPTSKGITYDKKTTEGKESVNTYTNVDEATKRCTDLNNKWRENRKKHNIDDDSEPWRIISKEVEEYDLKMATVLKPEDEWIILGTIDHKDGLLKAAPGQQVPINLVPDQMVGQSYCDHCHRTINRNKTVFVQKIKTGEILRVGGSCIRNYLGYEYEKVLTYLTDISFIDEYYGGFDGGGSDWDEYGGGWSGGRIEIEISTTEVIKYFYWWYKNHGYLSKTAADKINQKKIEDLDPDDYYKVKTTLSTSDLVKKDIETAVTPPERSDFKYNGDFNYEMNKWSEFVEKYNERCETITNEEVQWVVDFIHANRDNNFIFNASNMIKNGSVQKHLLYYITGACSWYFGKLAIEDAKKREAEGVVKLVSNWVGNVGEKMKLHNLEIVHISSYNSDFGWSNVYKLKDQNGNIFTKFGVIGTQFIVKPTEEGRIKDEKGELIISNPIVGDIVSATAEIKKHDEYKGTKQTTLGRFSKL
jgi:hypothetical protein